MAALYEIANDYSALQNEDMDAEMIADTLEGIEGEFTDKVEQIIALIKNNSALEEMLKSEAKSLTERARALSNKNANLKAYIAQSMSTMDKKKLNAGIHTITVRAGVKTAQIDDVNALPVEFVEYKTETVPDKKAILARLKAGETVEGATLATGKQSLIIK